MEETKSTRLLSLDIFRGITIAGMILVNNPGSWANIYPALAHAKWHGCTPTDYIFPFFLFIVGVAITLSLTKRKERGDNQNKLLFQIFRRGLMIFAIGIILQGFPYYNFSIIRIPGVLQRFGIVYFIASLIFMKTNVKTQSIIAVVLLFIYWAIMTLIPVPGFGMPYLDKPIITDSMGNQIAPNLAAWIDYKIFGVHLWKGTKLWDPEGLLSTIPAVSTALFGILLGHWLKSKAGEAVKVVWIFIFGNLGLVLGTIWDMWFPMNKGLWTSSYVLFTAGMALQFFGLCYWLVDVKGYKWWTKPFIVYGMNAITVFFLSGIMGRLMNLISWTNSDGKEIILKTYLYDTLFVPFFSPVNASLAWALSYVIIWLGLMWILYTKKIFIKV
jgi:predicted acyltransferase